MFHRWEDAPDYTAFCPLSGLPRLHGTRPDNVPAPVPYLHADPARVAPGPSGWTGWRHAATAASASSGRAGPRTTTTATAQLCSPTSHRSRDVARHRAGRVAERPGGRAGRACYRPRAADQHRRRDRRLRRHHGHPRQPRSCWLPSIPRSHTSPARWAVRSGSCCRARPTGAGCSIATTRRGIPAPDFSARRLYAAGMTWCSRSQWSLARREFTMPSAPGVTGKSRHTRATNSVPHERGRLRDLLSGPPMLRYADPRSPHRSCRARPPAHRSAQSPDMRQSACRHYGHLLAVGVEYIDAISLFASGKPRRRCVIQVTRQTRPARWNSVSPNHPTLEEVD